MTSTTTAPGDFSARAPASHAAESLVSPRHRKVLLALAEAAMPATARLEAGGPRTLARFERWLGRHPRPHGARHACGLPRARGLHDPHPRDGPSRRSRSRRAPRCSPAGSRARVSTVRALLRALLTPLKHAHFDRPEMFAHVGCRFELPAVRDEEPRWLAQVTDGARGRGGPRARVRGRGDRHRRRRRGRGLRARVARARRAPARGGRLPPAVELPRRTPARAHERSTATRG